MVSFSKIVQRYGNFLGGIGWGDEKMMKFAGQNITMKIVADKKIPFLSGEAEALGEVTFLDAKDIEPPAVAYADALFVRTRTRCDENLLRHSSIKFIGSATIGHDHIDTAWCDAHQIKWTNAPGCNANSVLQYIASALAWLHQRTGFSPQGKVLGVVGVGHVGSRVADLGRLLDMEVMLCDPPREQAGDKENFVSLEEIASKADVITFHTPLTHSGSHATHHMVNHGLLHSMNNVQLIINTSRGEIADAQVLKAWLVENPGILSVIDVWENEPEPDLQLMQLATIATPHIAGYSTDGKANGTAHVVNALRNYLNRGGHSKWFPRHLPEPESPQLYVDCNELSDNELFFKAFIHSYDISRDDFLLRHDPSGFEEIRDNYPVRREWPAFTLRLRDSDSSQRSALKKMGFKVKPIR